MIQKLLIVANLVFVVIPIIYHVYKNQQSIKKIALKYGVSYDYSYPLSKDFKELIENNEDVEFQMEEIKDKWIRYIILSVVKFLFLGVLAIVVSMYY